MIRVVKGRDGLGSLLVHLTRLCYPFSCHRQRHREGRTDTWQQVAVAQAKLAEIGRRLLYVARPFLIM